MTRQAAVATLGFLISVSAAAAQQPAAPTAVETPQPGSKPPPGRLAPYQAVSFVSVNSMSPGVAAEGVNRGRELVNERRSAQLRGVNQGASFTRLDQGVNIEFPSEAG